MFTRKKTDQDKALDRFKKISGKSFIKEEFKLLNIDYFDRTSDITFSIEVRDLLESKVSLLYDELLAIKDMYEVESFKNIQDRGQYWLIYSRMNHYHSALANLKMEIFNLRGKLETDLEANSISRAVNGLIDWEGNMKKEQVSQPKPSKFSKVRSTIMLCMFILGICLAFLLGAAIFLLLIFTFSQGGLLDNWNDYINR